MTKEPSKRALRLFRDFIAAHVMVAQAKQHLAPNQMAMLRSRYAVAKDELLDYVCKLEIVHEIADAIYENDDLKMHSERDDTLGEALRELRKGTQ